MRIALRIAAHAAQQGEPRRQGDREWTDRLIQQYYDLLQKEDAGFAQDLCAFFAIIGPELGHAARLGEQIGEHDLLGAVCRACSGADYECSGAYWLEHEDDPSAESREYLQLTLSVGEKVERFGQKWRLPSSYAPDLVSSYLRREEDGERLSVGDRAYAWPRPERIVPPCPLSFDYDLMTHDKRWLDARISRICADMRSSIATQAAAIQAEARRTYGVAGTRPHYGSADDVVWRLKRLYLRAVKRMSWAQIAVQEGQARGTTGLDRSSIKDSTERLAKRIGVPLS